LSSNLKAVVFDYNGTLVDDLDLHVESYYQAGIQMGYALDRDTVRRNISQPPSEKRRIYYGRISDARWKGVFELKKKIYFELAKSAFRLFPQTAEALTALSRRYALAVLSNTFRFFYDRYFPAELAKLFKATLFFEEVPEPKPDPAPMLTMLSKLGVAKSECCYVGDAVEDVHMAKAAGVGAYAVATGACTPEELTRAGADWVGLDLAALAIRLLADALPENR
jgi:HAD superfamily hydrolase (TIGR01509 family)